MRQSSFYDQLGNRIELSIPPRRIVSLVPSQTELLHFLGLEDRVIGITKFCELPRAWSSKKKIVGGTKKFWFEAIDELAPDLIIGNKEENYEEGINHLQERYPVWMSDIVTLTDALQMIEQVGLLTDRSSKAQELIQAIEHSLSDFVTLPPLRTLYLIWYQPWMGAAGDTFIHSMLELAGLRNVLADLSRYPALTRERITAINPELILLSSEPFPFGEKHREALNEFLPDTKVLAVDGKVFSWYGSRLQYAVDGFQALARELGN